METLIKHEFVEEKDDQYHLTENGYLLGQELFKNFDAENDDENKENIPPTNPKKRKRKSSDIRHYFKLQSPPPIKKPKTNHNNHTPHTPKKSKPLSNRGYITIGGHRMHIFKNLYRKYNITKPIVIKNESYTLNLVIDNAEHTNYCKSKRLDIWQSLKDDKNISTILSTLCCGDYMWILQNIDNKTDTQVLPFLVERKSFHDLSLSLSDKRYKSQKEIMKQAAKLFNMKLIYLLEGKITEGVAANKYKSIKQAIVSTEARDGFLVYRTENKKDTLRNLVNWTFMIREWIDTKLNDENALGSLPRLSLFKQKINEIKLQRKDTANMIFQRQLMEVGIIGLEASIAGYITYKYPTLRCLIDAWDECDDEKEAKLLIRESVMIGDPTVIVAENKDCDDDIMCCLKGLQRVNYSGGRVSKKLSTEIWEVFNGS